MFSLRKLMGKEDKFFDLLEASAEEARTSIGLLARFIQTRQTEGPPANLDEFMQSLEVAARRWLAKNRNLSAPLAVLAAGNRRRRPIARGQIVLPAEPAASRGKAKSWRHRDIAGQEGCLAGATLLKGVMERRGGKDKAIRSGRHWIGRRGWGEEPGFRRFKRWKVP